MRHYLVKMIADKHNAKCNTENTNNSVTASINNENAAQSISLGGYAILYGCKIIVNNLIYNIYEIDAISRKCIKK